MGIQTENSTILDWIGQSTMENPTPYTYWIYHMDWLISIYGRCVDIGITYITPIGYEKNNSLHFTGIDITMHLFVQINNGSSSSSSIESPYALK
jgi:hypothetical protein